MSEIIYIPILELMEKTEQWLLNQGYKKNTLGVYKATWNKFIAYSSSPFYDRETAEKFLLRYFGVDVNAIDQKLDMRMRHARRQRVYRQMQQSVCRNDRSYEILRKRSESHFRDDRGKQKAVFGCTRNKKQGFFLCKVCSKPVYRLDRKNCIFK